MDHETQRWYEDQFDLFQTSGWKELIKQAEQLDNNYGRISSVNSEQDLFFQKGQLNVLSWLLTWEDTVNQTYKDLKDDESQIL